MAEVIKHSILSCDEKYSDFLYRNYEAIQEKEEDTLISLVEQSCRIKQYYVEKI